MRNILIKSISLIVFMTLFLFNGCSRANEQSAGELGRAVDFTLEGIDGEKIILSNILKTKDAVLIFWTTWCPYCKQEVPDIERFYMENRDRVAVVGINVRENRAKVERYIRKNRISYPVVLDSNGNIARLYNLKGVPAIVAISKEDKIMYYGCSIKEMVNKVNF